MTTPEAVEPATQGQNVQLPAEKIIESLQRQIAQHAADSSFMQAKLETMIDQLTAELGSARGLIDELLAMRAATETADISSNGSEPSDGS